MPRQIVMSQAIQATSAAAPARRFKALATAWMRNFGRNLLDPYRPELHYMRGPGPKWREKHGQQEATAHLGDFGLPNIWKGA